MSGLWTSISFDFNTSTISRLRCSSVCSDIPKLSKSLHQMAKAKSDMNTLHRHKIIEYIEAFNETHSIVEPVLLQHSDNGWCNFLQRFVNAETRNSPHFYLSLSETILLYRRNVQTHYSLNTSSTRTQLAVRSSSSALGQFFSMWPVGSPLVATCR